MPDMLYHEKKSGQKGFSFVIGIDEAGRGPLAGPVVAAAVKLNSFNFKNKINDSKKLSPSQRERAFHEIREKSLVGIGVMSEAIIDSLNILAATRLAMEQAVGNLGYSLKKRISTRKTILLIDGNISLQVPFQQKSIIAGDSKSLSIAAASIIAKVLRDRIMRVYGKVYPKYGFIDNKGYGTKQHMQSIKKYGSCPIHRRSFRPIR